MSISHPSFEIVFCYLHVVDISKDNTVTKEDIQGSSLDLAVGDQPLGFLHTKTVPVTRWSHLVSKVGCIFGNACLCWCVTFHIRFLYLCIWPCKYVNLEVHPIYGCVDISCTVPLCKRPWFGAHYEVQQNICVLYTIWILILSMVSLIPVVLSVFLSDYFFSLGAYTKTG